MTEKPFVRNRYSSVISVFTKTGFDIVSIGSANILYDNFLLNILEHMV